MSRLRQRCFEIAVDNIANRDENSDFAWYEHYNPDTDSFPAAPSIADGMILPGELFFHCCLSFISPFSEKSSDLVLRLMALFKTEERARVFQSKLDLLATEVPFSLHKLTVVSERIPVTDPSSYHLVDLMMRDYNHEDEEDSPEMTFTHTVTVSTVPVNDDLVLFQSPQTLEDFVINAPLKAHIIDKASCVGHLASLKDCPDNFLALDSNLHNQFDGRSVNPSGVIYS